MKKKFYVESQINSALINSILVSKDSDSAYQTLTRIYDDVNIVDAIDNYLQFRNNQAFLYYFNFARETLKEILEKTLFVIGKIIDDDEELEATHADIIDMIKELNTNYNLSSKEYKNLENNLIISRYGFKKEQKVEDLAKSFSFDYVAAAYINGQIQEFELSNDEYPLLLQSICAYLNNIKFVDDIEITIKKINELFSFDYDGDEPEMVLVDKYKRWIKQILKENSKVDYKDFVLGNLNISEELKKEVEAEIDEEIHPKEKCKIYQIKNYERKGE